MRPCPKNKPEENPDFIEWIRKHRCLFCNGVDKIDKFGDPRVTPCHIKTKGSGGNDLYNVVPSCLKCHRVYEDLPGHFKRFFQTYAEGYATLYLKGE